MSSNFDKRAKSSHERLPNNITAGEKYSEKISICVSGIGIEGKAVYKIYAAGALTGEHLGSFAGDCSVEGAG